MKTKLIRNSEFGIRNRCLFRTPQSAFIIVLFLFLTSGILRADNVNVTNPESRPANVKIIGEFTSPSTTSVPGATPSPSPAKAVGVQGTGSASALPIPASDAGPSWTTVRGVSGVPFASADQHSAVASVTDAPTGGQKLVITDCIVSVDTAMSVTLKCETTGAVVQGPIYMAANSSVNLITRGKCKLATADKKLQVITSVAGNISVNALYYSEL